MLREQRELFSYRFPLSGPNFVGREAMHLDQVIGLCRLVAELASMNTECFQAALDKHFTDDLPIPAISDHTWSSAYQLAGQSVNDPDDRHRFNKFVRDWQTVSTLEVMATDGLMDDLYGAWIADDKSGLFDPDSCSRLLLAI